MDFDITHRWVES